MLILDNPDDPNINLSQYSPVGGRETILITTRNLEWAIHATVGSYKLGKMETKEAMRLILQTADVVGPSEKQTLEAARSVVEA